MSRIILDLTDIEQWSGIHGGTQRVVYWISRYFYLERESIDHEIVFMSFDAESKRFYVSDFEPIHARVEKTKDIDVVSDFIELQQPSLKAKIKKVVKPFVPKRLRHHPTVRRLASRAVSGLFVSHEPEIPQKTWVNFNHDDIVLILGKPWDNLDIQRVLTKERREHHFTLAQVVYDMIICLYPHLHHPSLVEPYTAHMKGAIANSDILLPISESTANDVRLFSKRYKLSCPKMEVIRLGDVIQPAESPAKPGERIARSFILCVGTLEIRKNHSLLYYAYKLAEEKGEELPQLVMVGSPGWLSGDVQHLIHTDPAMKDRILLLHGVKDEGLSWLFKHCLFSVYPSMYEGWGLPVAESLGYGKLALVSHASSLPEIAGDMIDYFSPYDSSECFEKILYYSKKKAERIKKEGVISRSYCQTPWEETARQVLDIVERV